MKRLTSVLITVLLIASASGCGPYRIRYTMPSKQRSEMAVTKTHAHGVGPIGGGGFFFVLHQMFPSARWPSDEVYGLRIGDRGLSPKPRGRREQRLVTPHGHSARVVRSLNPSAVAICEDGPAPEERSGIPCSPACSPR